jgi:hypothetical protein
MSGQQRDALPSAFSAEKKSRQFKLQMMRCIYLHDIPFRRDGQKAGHRVRNLHGQREDTAARQKWTHSVMQPAWKRCGDVVKRIETPVDTT